MDRGVVLISTGLRRMLVGENRRSLLEVFPFVVAFIGRCTKYKNAAPIARGHMRHRVTVADVTADTQQRGWG